MLPNADYRSNQQLIEPPQAPWKIRKPHLQAIALLLRRIRHKTENLTKTIHFFESTIGSPSYVLADVNAADIAAVCNEDVVDVACCMVGDPRATPLSNALDIAFTLRVKLLLQKSGKGGPATHGLWQYAKAHHANRSDRPVHLPSFVRLPAV